MRLGEWGTVHPVTPRASDSSASSGNAQNTLAQPTVWLTIALTTVVCILPVVAFRFLKLNLKPDLSDTVSSRVPGSPSGMNARSCSLGLRVSHVGGGPMLSCPGGSGSLLGGGV